MNKKQIFILVIMSLGLLLIALLFLLLFYRGSLSLPQRNEPSPESEYINKDVDEYLAYLLAITQHFDERREAVQGVYISNVDDDWLEETYFEAEGIYQAHIDREHPDCLKDVYWELFLALQEWKGAWEFAWYGDEDTYFEKMDKFNFKMNLLGPILEDDLADCRKE